ncbi:ESPR-type extended signal peptide-containing protein [Escherichia coli]|uniref:ESPR-type extended signal peptide-containing protein n=1 Tax=Escherichia coli TaxID=562 RepID=UPI00207F9327|nr:hypothetical protein ECZC06_55390 [Escherichia coli]
MNKIYKLKYSEITNSLIAVPEFASRAITGISKNNLRKSIQQYWLLCLHHLVLMPQQ